MDTIPYLQLGLHRKKDVHKFRFFLTPLHKANMCRISENCPILAVFQNVVYALRQKNPTVTVWYEIIFRHINGYNLPNMPDQDSITSKIFGLSA